MDVVEYQVGAHETAVYPKEEHYLSVDQEYVLMGLAGEAGEVANLCKKAMRGDFGKNPVSNPAFMDMLIKELGGAQWYLAESCTVFGILLEKVMEANLKLLADRQERGVIKGSGDDR